MKFNIHDHIPPLDEDLHCERCNTKGAKDFVGEILCNQCIYDDVFEDNERDN